MKKVLIAFVVIISMTQQTVTSRRSSWPRSGLWSTTSQGYSGGSSPWASSSPLLPVFATAWMISRRNPMVDRFTLAPKTVDAPYLDYSLNYDEQEARSAFLDILKYLDICELSRELSNRIAVCAEEIMNSLIGLKTLEGESCRHFFDVRMIEIMDDEGTQSRGIQFFLKARGKLFNPVRELSLNPDSMMTGNALSLLLVNKLCDHIDYNYRNGVNCVVMKFFKS